MPGGAHSWEVSCVTHNVCMEPPPLPSPSPWPGSSLEPGTDLLVRSRSSSSSSHGAPSSRLLRGLCRAWGGTDRQTAGVSRTASLLPGHVSRIDLICKGMCLVFFN